MSSATLALNLNPTMGAMFVAVVVSAVFYGVTTLQTIFYYSTYPRDALWIRVMVVFLWILDGLSLIMISYGLYTYLVIDYMDPFALEKFSRFYGAEPFSAATIAFVVHEFLVYRIWCLDNKFAPLAVLLALLSAFSCGLSIYAAQKAVVHPSLAVVLEAKSWSVILGNSLASFIDIVITCTICLQLYRSRTGVAKTERMLQRLTLYTITTGLIPAMICLAELISYEVAPAVLAFEVFEALVTKSYVNTFMASLNVRQSVRGKGLAETTTGNTPHGGNLATVEFHVSSDSSNILGSAMAGTLASNTPKETSETYGGPYGTHTV
ncbi:uncharacterized protein B0H18DRAFT_988893 [Fomitopsis serialis]|uniref:uncharacterized protein n=1 Tax=Fomitopsis serialis TaxID=139415 RepID=UPI00200758EF|nr:uncharacterized protein B0H18DRAFT_988893 [Neoantrodia serialis]KAH9931959.1 hypothetical protein B0H18DRAFT_988893 [Neoantrodia serialis]